MTSKSIDWTAILSDFVRRHPKTSAAIAFNLGVFAAQAAKSATKTHSDGLADIPAKLIELVPSMRDLGTYVPLVGGKPAAKHVAKHPSRRAPTRKPRKTVKRTTRKAG